MTNRELVYLVRNQKPLVLAAEEPVRNACRQMWERRAGSVLITAEDGRLSGIFTGRDAVRLLGESVDATTPLAQVMTRDPVTVPPQARAIDALRAMCNGGFRHVPVVENGNIVGIVSRGDFKGMEFEQYCWRHLGRTARSDRNRVLHDVVGGRRVIIVAANEQVHVACRMMSQAGAGSVLVADSRNRLQGIFTGRDAVRTLAKAKHPSTVRLSKAMTRDPVTLPPDCHAIDALRAMNDGGFRHIPIIDDGKIVGVVSRTDFTGFEIDRLDEEEHLKECIW